MLATREAAARDWILAGLSDGQELARRVAGEADLSGFAVGFVGTEELDQDLRWGRWGGDATDLAIRLRPRLLRCLR
ncbi:hypothetical protein CGZ92_05615 [Parenemella sanctibonifatiensis]|uniref:Uncharacterized protein n=1 Tax=Parenemella sanctibonifatiensis TaxID=2016505 RepID=A0A255EF94_9ACTN|nr:hypothetical protein CGZ92_05615 [Parenemella sanctibonifatiensis]